VDGALVGAGSLRPGQMWLPQYHGKFNIPLLNIMHYIYLKFLIYFLTIPLHKKNILYDSLFSIPNFFFFEIFQSDKISNISKNNIISLQLAMVTTVVTRFKHSCQLGVW